MVPSRNWQKKREGGGLVGGGKSTFKLFSWCWGLVDEQCCDSFRHRAKGLSLTCTRVRSPPNSPPIQPATGRGAVHEVLVGDPFKTWQCVHVNPKLP